MKRSLGVRGEAVFLTSTKRDGDLREFLKGLKLSVKDIVQAEQVHGSSVSLVKSSDIGRSLKRSDALITDEKGVPLMVRTADCLPIFIYDRGTPAIGLVHAGWRGTEKGIVKKALKKMASSFDSRPENCIIYMGPAIERDCYEFDEGKRHLDLAKENRDQIISLGVKKKNIHLPGHCTYCEKGLFHSFRRDRTDERNYSIAVLK